MEAFLGEFQHLKISLEEIKFATNNFGDNNLIGNGGFGKVYFGEISNSNGPSMVAFKRLDRRHGQGDPEFWKEILTLFRYRHENLISLLGFCNEGDEMILVYEHASHRSLDHHLNAATLTWTQRLKICLAAARGLNYLHDPRGTQQRVLHRDIKSSNILLDDNWNAKVSDFGLSKIGPANQKYTVLFSAAVGTLGYCDPLYMEMGFLTKESDVYSFGVVLFEVLCGKLCFEYINGQCQILVPTWKQSYKQKKLDEIIFPGLLQQMDSRSLETFADLAYRCLLRSREERPTMAYVVEKLEASLKLQVRHDVKLPKEYKEIVDAAVPSLSFGSVEELKVLLSEGIHLNGGKKRFSLNKKGEHCEMIYAAECLFPVTNADVDDRHMSQEDSRFPVRWKFKTHVRTQFLSPGITYTVNLVFKLVPMTAWGNLTFVGLKYKLKGETKSYVSYIADRIEDGLFMTELYQFTSDTRKVDLEILFVENISLEVEGIEFRPVEEVEHKALADKKVDVQPISDVDTKWQNFPYYGEQWFYLDKNGKKCHMLPARAAFNEQVWEWLHSDQLNSRFREVASDPHVTRTFNYRTCSYTTGISIVCEIRSQMLSPQTTYGSYHVYKLTKNHSQFQSPRIVNDQNWLLYGLETTDLEFIYLLDPQTPVIRQMVDQNTHNPLNRPKMKGLPRQRNDGWMEVQIWEFRTGFTTKTISMHVDLGSIPFYRGFYGLVAQGIEFKPI